MVNESNGLVVVIPTRNRPNLAAGAIQSVLSQGVDGVRILVSDNSTTAEETASLSRYCRQLEDERLDYVTPPRPMSMGDHWEWAMQHAIRFGDASHFTVLTDRMIFRPGELQSLVEIVRDHPRKIISYKHEQVVDYKQPVGLAVNNWTGKLFEVESSRLLYLSSQALLHQSLPRMLNCIVPRNVIDAITSCFGALMSSFAPDFSFCYRALAVESSILYYDKSALIERGCDRSNGQSMARGLLTRDYADFLANVDQKKYFFAAPIPTIRTRFNVMVHEYCFVKEKSKSLKFPDVDMEKYLQFIARELEEFEDQNLRDAMRKILVTHGWTESPPGGGKNSGSQTLPTLIAIKTKLKCALPKRCWPFFTRLFAIQPPIDAFSFKSAEEALAYTLRFPGYPLTSQAREEQLLEYKMVADRKNSLRA
jgi:hypothetical protein